MVSLLETLWRGGRTRALSPRAPCCAQGAAPMGSPCPARLSGTPQTPCSPPLLHQPQGHQQIPSSCSLVLPSQMEFLSFSSKLPAPHQSEPVFPAGAVAHRNLWTRALKTISITDACLILGLGAEQKPESVAEASGAPAPPAAQTHRTPGTTAGSLSLLLQQRTVSTWSLAQEPACHGANVR